MRVSGFRINSQHPSWTPRLLTAYRPVSHLTHQDRKTRVITLSFSHRSEIYIQTKTCEHLDYYGTGDKQEETRGEIYIGWRERWRKVEWVVWLVKDEGDVGWVNVTDGRLWVQPHLAPRSFYESLIPPTLRTEDNNLLFPPLQPSTLYSDKWQLLFLHTIIIQLHPPPCVYFFTKYILYTILDINYDALTHPPCYFFLLFLNFIFYMYNTRHQIITCQKFWHIFFLEIRSNWERAPKQETHSKDGREENFSGNRPITQWHGSTRVLTHHLTTLLFDTGHANLVSELKQDSLTSLSPGTEECHGRNWFPGPQRNQTQAVNVCQCNLMWGPSGEKTLVYLKSSLFYCYHTVGVAWVFTCWRSVTVVTKTTVVMERRERGY